MPRMRILNAVEQHDFDWPPVFNSLQRKKYLNFSGALYKMATGLRLLIETGCATTPQVKYEPVGSRDGDACFESNDCIIETDVGEGLISFGEKSSILMNFVDEEETQSENAKNAYYDYLITVSNISESVIYFDPEDIKGYNQDAELAALRKSKNTSYLIALGAVALGAVAGGTD